MSLKDDLTSEVNGFFNEQYTVTDGREIPSVTDIAFGNSGRELDLAMLFIDIRESTKIVDGFRRVTAAKMYKSFLTGVARIARANDGRLCSFNGDGVLIAFGGDLKCTHAAKAALQMSWFVKKVLAPRVEQYFQANRQLQDMSLDFDIGIDVGRVLVVRGGMRGSDNNDLVWVGNATNYAVKLSSIPDDGYHVFISKEVYGKLNASSKLGGNPQKNMWENRTWKDMTIYRSNWTWAAD
jgi:class 3 adenylate cyclase